MKKTLRTSKSLKQSNNLLLAADFETTVYEGQTSTEVWSAAYCELYTENVMVRHSIDEFLDDLFAKRKNIVCWFHNLRFDGSFIMYRLLKNGWSWSPVKNRDMLHKEFKALISEQNRWYSITLKYHDRVIEFRDSLKLMPMSLKVLAESFQTKHRKLEMEYTGRRYAGCEITPEEMSYIINDVLVLKESLEVMLDEGHDKLTIGSCCMQEFKQLCGDMYELMFPNLKGISLDDSYGSTNADEYIRKSYHGGWCYLKPKYAGVYLPHQGRTYDVNSLYPSVMHSESGNYYAVGQPHFFKKDIPEICSRSDIVWVVRVKCCFQLKGNHLPTIQIRKTPGYKPSEWLETSDIKYKGKYFHTYTDFDGKVVTARPELTLTMTDYKLLLDHYVVTDLEILDGVWFYGEQGIFDGYLDKYKKIKETSKGARRTIAKLFSNNLYGKLSTSENSSYLTPVLVDDVLQFDLSEEYDKDTISIINGSLVTSNARNFTIRHAQMNYQYFIYADTDSLHGLDGEWVGIDEHPTAYQHWKLESEWSAGVFIRQKTYAEFVRRENHAKVSAYWDLKCAGLSDRGKKKFLETHPITDFREGLVVPGANLKPERIPGGTLLKPKDYTMRKL